MGNITVLLLSSMTLAHLDKGRPKPEPLLRGGAREGDLRAEAEGAPRWEAGKPGSWEAAPLGSWEAAPLRLGGSAAEAPEAPYYCPIWANFLRRR